MFLRCFHLAHIAGWAALGLGLLLQFALKDHVFGLRLLFYAMPKPCLLALAVTLLVWPKAGWPSRLAALAVAVLLAGTWVHRSWRAEAPAVSVSSGLSGGQQVKLLFWNLCRPTGLHQGMVDMVRELQPDIAAFVEPGQVDMEAKCRTYEKLLPGYHAAWMPRGILWLSRVPSRYRLRGKLEGSGAFARFEVNGLGPTFPVVVADVYPHPLHWRKGQLEEALDHTQGRGDAILVGDFNTPLESALFAPYRARMTHALEAAGTGFKETWPMGLPLLSLDHVWYGPEWQAVNAQKIWRTQHSDHAALLVTLKRRHAESIANPDPHSAAGGR